MNEFHKNQQTLRLMSFFPVLSSTLSPEAIADYIANQYGMGDSFHCEVMKTGINHTYLLKQAERRFVYRVYFYNWRTRIEVEEELRLIMFLKEAGMKVSYPIPDKNNTYIQQLDAPEGERMAVLFSFAAGKSVRNPSLEMCHHFGVVMGKMHQLTLDYQIKRKSYDAHNLVGWAVKALKSRIPDAIEEISYVEKAYSLINSKFGAVDAGLLRFGTVHLDLWYGNMSINEQADITLFDFDNCGNGWLFLDVAYSLMLLFRNEVNKELFERKKARFLEGYLSITSISPEEYQLLPYGGLAIWLHYSGIHAHRFPDTTNVFFSQTFLKHWIHSVNQWMLYNEITI